MHVPKRTHPCCDVARPGNKTGCSSHHCWLVCVVLRLLHYAATGEASINGLRHTLRIEQLSPSEAERTHCRASACCLLSSVACMSKVMHLNAVPIFLHHCESPHCQLTSLERNLACCAAGTKGSSVGTRVCRSGSRAATPCLQHLVSSQSV